MALSLVNGNLVWQQVQITLDSLGANSAIRDSFRALKAYLSQVKGNPTLQFVAISSTDVDHANGQLLADVPCKVHAIFGKKLATATDVYLAILDDEADDASPIADVRAVLGFITTGEQALAMYPAGLAMAKGVVAKAYTEFDGTTDSVETDCPNGFIIISAA